MPDRLRAFWRGKFVQDTLALQVGKIAVAALTALMAVLAARLLGAETYGEWALVGSFLTLWSVINLTGIAASAAVRLPMAVGAGDADAVRDEMAHYVQIAALWALFVTASLALVGPALAARLYEGDARIGQFAIWLSLTSFPDALYSLIVTALQSRRLMRSLSLLITLNQAVLVVATLAALLVAPRVEGLLAARLIYSVVTLALAFGFYGRLRRAGGLEFPAWRAVAARAVQLPPWRGLGFGFLNALDKNIADFFTQLPLQLTGIFAGPAAAGYLSLAFRGLSVPAMLTSALFDNVAAVVPQAVGRGDFAWLRRAFPRVLLALAGGAFAFYTAFALLAPWGVPLLLSSAWTPAVPAVVTLALYGGLTMVGGVFGPLYRALGLLRSAIGVKLLSLALVMPLAWLSFRALGQADAVWRVQPFLAPWFSTVTGPGAVLGAWAVNAVFGISIGLTALRALWGLRRAKAAN